MSPPTDTEFGYELCVCRWAELAWPPAGTSAADADDDADDNDADDDAVALVARQLGTKQRRWDTVIVECDPAALRQRASFGDRELDSDLLHVVRNAPADWQWYQDALPAPEYPWRYVREAVHRAADRDCLNTRKQGNRIEIKQIAPYPDWVNRLIAIENKPDLEASAADQLASQLEHDVETGLADEVWVATTKTGATVEPALLESLPVEAGILTTDFSGGVDHTAADVAWHPTALTPTHDSEYRRSRRVELAERAYGRGWRSYHTTMRPDCRQFELRRKNRLLVPWCAAKTCHQTAGSCSRSCDSFEPEPPTWRMKNWPLDGGPGAAIKRLLAKRADRNP